MATTANNKAIKSLLEENQRRRDVLFAPFNPVTGLNSVGERKPFTIPDYPIPTQYLPVEMLDEPFVKRLKKAGTVKAFITKNMKVPYSDDAYDKVVEMFVRIRIKYDFPFWASTFVFIKNKDGGPDILFRLNRPQRRLVAQLERMRKKKKPIRLVILKARQWGGSTCIQIFMAWLQLVHSVGLNSLIIAHISSASDKIKSMFDKMIKAYPVEMLHNLGDSYSPNEPKIVGVGRSGSIFRVPQRNCEINIGTAESQEGPRSGAYNLIHFSEMGLFKLTEAHSPEEIVQSATTGVLYRPNTMIVYESTAKGVGTFFHGEYTSAKEGKSQFESIFVPHYEIEQYELPFDSPKDMELFARRLYDNRNNTEVNSEREEPCTYLWWLWNQGATLENINWYIQERTKFTSHGAMANEYPSDDIEAFTFSGLRVFPNEDVEQFRSACRPPRWVGEVYGAADEGGRAFENLRFKQEKEGRLNMWADVERDTQEDFVRDRYLVSVDVCKGHTANADFADILVLDRLPMIDGEPPVVVAEWHGHIDMDKLAWKAAQIAAYYNNALLVIESNTLETNNTKGEAEYVLTIIREHYDNLYARKQSAEDIKEGRPRKYGFHTNALTKKVIIIDLKTTIRDHLYVEREKDCLDEYCTYVETDKGGYEAMQGCHDDRLMTRAIGLYICFKEMDMPQIVHRDLKRSTAASRETVSAASII